MYKTKYGSIARYVRRDGDSPYWETKPDEHKAEVEALTELVYQNAFCSHDF